MNFDPQYQARTFAKWKEVLEADGGIKNQQVAMATALVLENTVRESGKRKFMSESYTPSNGANPSVGGMGAGAGTNLSPAGGGAFGSATDLGSNDARYASMVLPMLRRVFPLLAVHELVGVQAMPAPVGYAFAMRYQYGMNKAGVAGSTSGQGTEAGFRTVDTSFTGATGALSAPPTGSVTASNIWSSFGAGRVSNGGGSANAEWWKVGEDYPMAQFALEKEVIDAKTRKLAAHWSRELAEDMVAMHGINVEESMAEYLSFEIMSEIEQQILAEIVNTTVNNGVAGKNYSTWSPVSADGRHQAERVRTLYTQAVVASQAIAKNTMRAQANWAIADATTIGILESLGDSVIGKVMDTEKPGIAQVGTLRQGSMKLYRDSLFNGTGSTGYLLLGYKGQAATDSGIIYCPYVPLQLMKETSDDDFTPRIGVRTRYGVAGNKLVGSHNYYHYIHIDGLNNAALAADGGRVFLY